MSNNYDMNNNFYNNKGHMRNTKSFQAHSYNTYFFQEINPFPKIQNIKKLSQNIEEKMLPIYLNNDRRNTMPVLPFPNDTLLDEENSNNLHMIPPEMRLKKVTKINPKIINDLRNRNSYYGYNSYLFQNNKKEVFSENIHEIKKSPMDEFSGNSSDIKNLKSKSDIDSEKYNKINSKINILKKDNDDSNNINNKTINKKLKTNNNNPNKKINIKNKNQNNKNQNKTIIQETLKNQFINRNSAMFALLRKDKFIQKLNQISQYRMNLFEKEYKNDPYFKKKEFYNNVFIKNSELGNMLPLTLIFHYLLNPKTEIKQFSLKNNFYENVLLLHGFKNVKIKYDSNVLNQVPKFFDDLNYVNILFHNFEMNELNKFVYEIKNWTKSFDFEVSYEDLNNNNIYDKIRIYLISPLDITVEYNSNSANSFKSFAEFNFHCDIDYDKNKGRFIFKTSANVYNKCEELWQYEFLGEIWERAIIVIKEESQKNKLIMDKIFKEYLKKNLNKYSPIIEHNINDIVEEEKKEKSNNNKLIEKIKFNKDNITEKNTKEISSEFTRINNNDGKEKNKILNKKFEKSLEKSLNNNNDRKKEQILLYGVLLSFFIFIFKTVLTIEQGTFSLETFFNLLIIIIIGFMLLKNKSLDIA